MKLLNIKTAYSHANDIYGVTLSETDFENIALNAWEMIGTKHTKLHKYIGCTSNRILMLPCNCDVIESVHIPLTDAQITNPTQDYIDFDNLVAEKYINMTKKLEDPYFQKGKFVKYKEIDGGLQFARDYDKVMVVYHGVEVDEDNLPLINEKEMRAIAAYVAYSTLYKEGLMKRDGGIIQLAQTIKTEWLQLCNAARIPAHLSQNDMDSVLDAKVRYDRKQYGKSFKPLL